MNNDDLIEALLAETEDEERRLRRYEAVEEMRRQHSTIPNCECPTCGSPMVVRRNRNSGEQFAGCTNYPQCRGTRQMRDGAVVTEEEDRTRPRTERERIRELEDKVSELEDKINELMHYYQEGEAA